ncbi:AAA family ATPase [Geobacter sp. AOG1]|uniref:cytidylate kinase-like family protein n=1 Tax=Geobacter sp. AOG1 TaxID=1566346 RepID=UPI001CC4BFF3|nr:cytidylate kinase-like family protein [Geobacter sp. AOG1]GFE57623.1 cytidylate kinase [Geobacter sp. AOG1]
MSEKLLVPSIEKRLASFLEVSRRNLKGPWRGDKVRPTITISREFGCEGFPVTEKLQELLEKQTGDDWTVMDKALLEEVAKHHNLSEELLHNLGEKNRFIDDMVSTFSSRWKSDKDYYRLLCKQIVALSEKGNVIIIGRGASILTQDKPHCYHFRMIASQEFKLKSITKRLGIDEDEAEKLIRKKQRQREEFIKDFLNRDVADPTLYHLVFNNAKNPADVIAETISHYVSTRLKR